MAYVAEDNVASLRSNQRRGYRLFERVLERHVLFRYTRQTIERADPPAAVPVPQTHRAPDRE